MTNEESGRSHVKKQRFPRVGHHRHAFPPRGKAAERGFTIAELIVAITVLGVIMVPIATTLLSASQVNDRVRENINASVNRDVLSSYFTNDVASVDAAGVSSNTSYACDTSPSGGGTLFVTFNSTKLTSGGTLQMRRTSYWITGSGKATSLERRSCEGITPSTTTAATAGAGAVVADSIGKAGVSRVDTVVGFSTQAPGPVCDEVHCAIWMPYTYQAESVIKAQRRVFGAGVPMEAGRLFSSSKSADPATGVAYSLYTIAGAAAGTEQQLLNSELTLAPGLDAGMDVKFAVQQVATGNWLQQTSGSDDGAGSGRSFASWGSTGQPYVKGHFENGQWKLEGFTMGATGIVNYGGEYRIYTSLQESSASSPKVYGGVSGFPLWVDWKPDEAVFVKSGTGCVPTTTTGAGLTASVPVCNLADGLTVAQSSTRPNVLMSAVVGSYSETTLSGATAANRTVYGGFDAKWLRLAPSATNGRAGFVGSTGAALVVDGRTGLRLRQLDLNSGPAPEAGSSTYGIRIANASVSIEQSRVVARDAGSAPGGVATAASGEGGCIGGNGGDGYWSGLSVNGGSGGGSCGGSGVRRGGSGGRAHAGGDDGEAGENGGGGAAGGRGGCGNAVGLCFTDPAPGRSAGPASPGSGGSGGANTALSAASTWIPRQGATGGVGPDGQGGGGGGGGSSTWLTGGGGGGAGGTGGSGGGGGAGGNGGGGSFGIYAYASNLAVTDTTVGVGTGGSGGRGGNGGAGGAGGAGGDGGSKTGGSATGGSGGGGGSGGAGGGGGQGGPGGPAINIMVVSPTVAPAITGVGYTPGTPGTGGAGGSGGAGGARGNIGGVATYPGNAVDGFLGISGDCGTFGFKCSVPGQLGYTGSGGNGGSQGATGRSGTLVTS